MSMAIYRKYRSRSLEEIVGQEHVTDILKRAIKSQRISHAYLLTGPRGVGKTSIARIMAHAINGLPYDGEANHLDIIEIDAASNRRIDDVRDLREKIHIAPVNARYKVYIIDEVHMLTGESFNALLKTLEEPPAHAVFIMATTEAHKLPATIVSRTQRFALRPIDEEKVVAHLRSIATKENISISDDALALIAQHGGGSFRDSISLLDQLSASSDGEVGEDEVTQSLGIASKATLESLLGYISKNDIPGIIAQHSKLESNGYSVGSLTNQLIAGLRKAAERQPELYRLIDSLLEVTRSSNPSLKLLTTVLDYMMPSESVPAKKPKYAPAASTIRPVAAVAAVLPARKAPKAAVAPLNPKTTKLEKESKGTPGKTFDIGAFDSDKWPAVLAALKKANPPLYGVVKHADTQIGKDATELRLIFGYALHSKKIDDPKYRLQLSSIITDICGSCPIISVETAKKKAAGSATKTIATPATAGSSSETSSILAIMGGGEVMTNGA